MRDVNRIPKVLKEIEIIWKKHPDYRLCQLIGNVFHGDNYYVEDDRLIEGIKAAYVEDGKIKK